MELGLKPLRGHVIIEHVEPETMTKGGLHIPERAQDDRCHRLGRVLAVGPGEKADWGRIPIPVEVGDIVIYQGSWAGIPIPWQGKSLRFLDWDDCAAVVPEGVRVEHQTI